MLQENDSNGNNILLSICHQYSLEHLEYDVLPDFFKVVKKEFNADELKDFLTSSNSHRSNCLLLAVKLRSKYFIAILFNIIRAELSIDDQQSMIQKHDLDGNNYNIFNCASQNCDAEIFSFVKDLVKEILSDVQYMILDAESSISKDEESLRCNTDE